MAGMSTYPFKCDLCGGVTELAPTYGDFSCQHCGQVYVYDECHRIELSERQLQTLRDSRWIAVSERLPEERVRVLACGDDPVEGPFTLIGYREPESKFGPAHWHLPCFAEFGPVTHWMPLPEPPEVK
jgi:predicted RNA-binding Zn-ribbon protein involved in translation (DUF1610 family)